MRDVKAADDGGWRSAAAGFPRVTMVAGDAILVELGDAINEAVRARVVGLDAAINEADIPELIETVPAYTSVLVRFDPTTMAPDELESDIVHFLSEPSLQVQQQRTWVIPVAYGGRFAPDIDYLSGLHGLSSNEIIRLHAEAPYSVSMFGFLPGFAYLAGLPLELATPRRTRPRDVVPGGGIAIGGPQTAIGSVEGPCGWHIIGRTPVRLFAAERAPATFLKIGDRVRFRPIEVREFAALQREADRGAIVAECNL